MVALSLLRIGLCQDGHLATARRDTLQSSRPVAGAKDDGVVGHPRGAAQRRIEARNGDRRAPRQRDFHECVGAVRCTRLIDHRGK